MVAKLIDKLVNMTLGGTIASVTNFGLKTSAKVLTPTRLRSIGVAAGIYYGGNYLLTKAGQDMSADYGSDTYSSRYQSGENLARGAIAGAALSKAVLGGIFNKSLTKSIVGAASGSTKSAASIFSKQAPLNRLSGQPAWLNVHHRYKRYTNYLKNKPKESKMIKRAQNSWAFAASRKGALTGATLLGAGMGYYSENRRPVALEGRNIDVFGGNSSSKMNFNTAGLVQAMHDKRKRLA